MERIDIRKIGLTGGIGSGKSTVGQMLQARGLALVDADAISRALTAPQGAAVARIRDVFGPEFITAEQALDRERMRTLVFGNPEAKQRLEGVLHPLVAQGIRDAVAQIHADGHRQVVLDIPLLVESSRWRKLLDRVWVVDCSTQTQIQRVVQRSGMSHEAVAAIVAAQATRAQRLAAADAVIHNEGLSLAQLQEQVQALALDF